MRILVIDDDIDGADALAALLTQSGHDVRVAYGGTQALSLAVAFAAEAATWISLCRVWMGSRSREPCGKSMESGCA